jgi:hypothetical protein
MVLVGEVEFVTPAGNEILLRGETVLIPASCCDCDIVPQGEATLLETFEPASL